MSGQPSDDDLLREMAALIDTPQERAALAKATERARDGVQDQQGKK